MTASLLLASLLSPPAHAGLGPMSVLLVYNADDPDAVALAERYAEARSVPDANVCGVSGVDPTADAMSLEDYLSLVLEPVVGCVWGIPQPDELGALVIIKGLPYRVDLPAYSVSLDAALQLLETSSNSDGSLLVERGQLQTEGLYYASVENPVVASTTGYVEDFTLENPYMGWYITSSGLPRGRSWPRSYTARVPGSSQGWQFSGQLLAVGRLDGFTYEDAHALLDRALAAEEARPEGEWLCMASADAARGARDPECELATRRLNSMGYGHQATWLDTHDANLSGHEVVAYFTGAAGLTGAIDGQTYAPGAVVDNLTSFGAVPNNFRCSEDGETCPASESQTSIARFVRAGATGVHGTVAEPLNNVFPNAAAMLLYGAGYSMGESWLYSTWHLYWQNIFLGDPLTTPWRERPVVSFSAADSLPEGISIQVNATHPDGVAEIRLYVEGVRVAEGPGPSLRYNPGLREGVELDLVAVAVAEEAPLTPEDWPHDDYTLHTEVQGWRTARLTITEALPDEDTALWDSGEEPIIEEKACGCASTRPGASLSWLLLIGLSLSRRRMTADPGLDRVLKTASRDA